MKNKVVTKFKNIGIFMVRNILMDNSKTLSNAEIIFGSMISIIILIIISIGLINGIWMVI